MRKIIASILFVATALCAEEVDENYRSAPAEAMRLSGYSPDMESLLQGYYQNTFGGSVNWDRIQSVRFQGMLKLSEDTMEFVGFKKKPNFCKVVLYGTNHMRMVMATDGEDAWQLLANKSVDVFGMPEAEAANFLRDATIGGHLLYPNWTGKEIELLGTERVSGELCYRFKVTLPDEQVVEYFIDATSFIERRQIVTNMVSGQQEVTDHYEHREVHGLQIPFRSVMSVDGKQVHEIRLLDVDVNLGLTSWMFARGAAAYIPKAGRQAVGVSNGNAVNLSFTGEDSGMKSQFQMPEIDEAQREQLLRDIEVEL